MTDTTAAPESAAIEPDPSESDPAGLDGPASTAYTDAIEEYLDAADWLKPLDGPMKVHVRALARSLDQQVTKTGEIQSALASSFDKAMMRLEARRPAPMPVPGGPQIPGQTSILDRLDD